MICEAYLTTESTDATAVCESLKVENVSLDKLKVRTYEQGGKVVSQISCESVSTCLSTLDDLIRCQICSEAVIENG